MEDSKCMMIVVPKIKVSFEKRGIQANRISNDLLKRIWNMNSTVVKMYECR